MLSTLFQNKPIYTAAQAFDNDETTICHTYSQNTNTLTLNFEESYVSDVEIVNRNKHGTDETLARIDGAVVQIMMDEVVTKVCGTIKWVRRTDYIYKMKCGAAANSLVIQLNNNYLHVAEVRLFGLGKCDFNYCHLN